VLLVVLIAAAHLVGGMAKPAVDQPLVDALGSAIARETVAGKVPTIDHLPATTAK